MDLDDALAPSGSTYSYKTEMNEGDVFQGILQAKPQVSADVDFNTKVQKTTKGGNPMWQIKLTLEVDGESKNVWLKDKAYWAAVNAFREAKAQYAKDNPDAVMEFRGGIFALKREADGEPTTKGFAAPKNYVAKFRPVE